MSMKRISQRWLIWLLGIGIMLLTFSMSADAEEPGEKNIIYTAATGSATESFGDGTYENPYNQFEDAVANVSDGGIIYIMTNGAFLNETETDMPFVIGKSISIEPEPGAERAKLSTRTAGIVLGADVSFTNIELSVANPYHAQIFANGHSLSMNNVSCASSARLVDLVAGSLYDSYGNLLGTEPGDFGQILIQGNQSEFGNIYAGSLNGTFNGNVFLNIQNTKSARIGDIFASGASEVEFNRDNWFDFGEPPTPMAEAELYPVSGKVNITLNNASAKKIEGLGALGGTEVSASTEYIRTGLIFTNLTNLAIEQGSMEFEELTARASEVLDLTVNSGGTIDLSKIGNVQVNNFNGGGTIILGQNANIRIIGNVTGKTVFETEGGYGGHSGIALDGHVYIEANPEAEGEFSFIPYPTQANMNLVRQEDGSWKIISDEVVFIDYWTENPEMGDVSINWEMLDPENGVPEGAVAEAYPGYHFVKWVDEEGNEVSKDMHFLPQKTENKYIEAGFGAVFEPNAYKIIFDANGGTGTDMSEQQCIYGESQKLFENKYIYEGRTFIGWNTVADGTGTSYSDQQDVLNLKTESNSTIVLYAQWSKQQYTIHFDKNGATSGSMNDMDSCSFDIEYNLPANAFAKKGYTFAGWATTSDGAVVYKDKAKISNLADKDGKTITLYAKWNAVDYTISYSLNGGTNSSSNPKSYKITTTTIMLKTPSKKGYTFGGWYTSANYSTKVTQIPKGSTGNKTLYAKWTANTYKVAFNKNSGTGSMSTVSYTYNKAAALPANTFSRSGYSFRCWNTKSDGSGTNYANKASVNNLTSVSGGTVTLYAQWAKGYKLSYHANGGTVSTSSKTVYQGLTYGTLATPTRKGYSFSGWYTAASGGSKVTSSTKMTAGKAHTLYAHWSKINYTVKYVLNGGTNSKSNPTAYTITSTTITLKNPTRTGYTFKGWYTSSSYKTKVTQITKGSVGNKTFYASWTANKYTIRYNKNGATSGTMSDTTSCKYGTSYTLKANAFKRTGYTFAGWATSSTGKVIYKNKASVKNLSSTNGAVKTLYAKWTPNTYKITYYLNGGKNGSNPTSYKITSNTIILKNPTKTGYTFKGWYTSSSYKTKVSQIPKGSTGNRTLYAKWVKK